MKWPLAQESQPWPSALHCFVWSQTLGPQVQYRAAARPRCLWCAGPNWGLGSAEWPGFRASPKPALPILQLTEKLLDLENENMMRVAELEKQLLQREKELESIKVLRN